jgi:hypothetical protein
MKSKKDLESGPGFLGLMGLAGLNSIKLIIDNGDGFV